MQPSVGNRPGSLACGVNLYPIAVIGEVEERALRHRGSKTYCSSVGPGAGV